MVKTIINVTPAFAVMTTKVFHMQDFITCTGTESE